MAVAQALPGWPWDDPLPPRGTTLAPFPARKPRCTMVTGVNWVVTGWYLRGQKWYPGGHASRRTRSGLGSFPHFRCVPAACFSRDRCEGAIDSGGEVIRQHASSEGCETGPSEVVAVGRVPCARAARQTASPPDLLPEADRRLQAVSPGINRSSSPDSRVNRHESLRRAQDDTTWSARWRTPAGCGPERQLDIGESSAVLQSDRPEPFEAVAREVDVQPRQEHP